MSTNEVASPRTESQSLVDHLVEQWKRLGVTTVFGVPGSAIGPLVERVLRDDALRFVMARHEAGAVAMADGYARTSGRLGVAMVTSGPGALNALPYLVAADADNSPVLLVSGDVARRHAGRGAIQESGRSGLRVAETFAACVGYSETLSYAASAPRLVANALRHALTAPRGAAHLSIPVDLHGEPVPTGTESPTGMGQVWRAGVDPEVVADLRDLLLAARRPLILLGNGSRPALTGPGGCELGGRLREFSARFAVPVVTTTKGKGLFPERDETGLGVVSIGGSDRARAYLDGGVDVLLVVGSGLGEWATRNWTPELQAATALVQVDVDPTRIGRAYRADQGIVADAGAFLRRLVEPRGATADPTAVEARRTALGALPSEPWQAPPQETDPTPARPQDVVGQVREWLDSDLGSAGERIVLLDAGNTTGWFTRLVPLDDRTRVLAPWGVATMGWPNAAVVGAKIAAPDSTCISVTGDGGFLMNAVEISSAARRGIGAIWLVAQDDAYGMVRQGMGHAYPDTYDPAVEDFGLGSPDLAAFAESLGADAHRVERASELGAVLAKAEQAARDRSRPQVVVVPVDPGVAGPFEDRHAGVARGFGTGPAGPDDRLTGGDDDDN